MVYPELLFRMTLRSIMYGMQLKGDMYLQKIVLLRQMKGYLPKRNLLKLWPRG